jgi:hypothetical protein
MRKCMLFSIATRYADSLSRYIELKDSEEEQRIEQQSRALQGTAVH